MTWNDAYLRHVQAIIAEDGYAVQYVGGDAAADQRPFAYTVGLQPITTGTTNSHYQDWTQSRRQACSTLSQPRSPNAV